MSKSKSIFKILLFAILGVVALIALAFSYVSFALPNVGEAPTLQITPSPEKVQRGEYLALHVMVCADCHARRDFSLFSGPPIVGTMFAGGETFDQKMGLPGVFVAPNITPHNIGDWTDGEIFRLITTGVKKDGEPIFPVMPFPNYARLDPEDIEAVIAYLRTLEPINTSHPASKADFPVNLIMRTTPQKAVLSVRPSASDVVAYGQYVTTAAGCMDCHTRFEKGEFIGPEGGGGREFPFPDGRIVRSANLTPHETGLKQYSKAEFIQHFKVFADSAYVIPVVKPGELQTPMPWLMYSGMTEEDLGAIYEYLNTLTPADNRVEKLTLAVQ